MTWPSFTIEANTSAVFGTDLKCNWLLSIPADLDNLTCLGRPEHLYPRL